jgi:hypothetical protein
VIVGPEALSEQLELLTRRRDPAHRTDLPILSDRDLARALTDIYPNETHHLSLLIDDGRRVGGETTTTDTCAQHTRAKSQGRPPRKPGSQPTGH